MLLRFSDRIKTLTKNTELFHGQKTIDLSFTKKPFCQSIASWHLENELNKLRRGFLGQIPIAILNEGLPKDQTNRAQNYIDHFPSLPQNLSPSTAFDLLCGKSTTSNSSQENVFVARILNHESRSTASIVEKSIYWAVDHGAELIFLGAQTDYPYRELYNAVQYAFQHHCYIICPNYHALANLPGQWREVISVSKIGRLAYEFANHLPEETSENLLFCGDLVDMNWPGATTKGNYSTEMEAVRILAKIAYGITQNGKYLDKDPYERIKQLQAFAKAY